jgi:hypothetical protein
VVEQILDWVSVGGGPTTAELEIPALMDGFLVEFVTSTCGLELSEVVRDYIVQLVTRSGVTWHWHIDAAPWEGKAAALLTYVTNSEDRAAALLAILKAAPVPWSPCVER